MRRNSLSILGLACLALFAMADVQGIPAEVDIRHDAVVEAVSRVRPSVVNISTTTLVPMQDPFEELFREFFDPYHRRRAQPQYSLGSGVIVDEEGYILTNNHVVQRGIDDPTRSQVTVLIGTNLYVAKVEAASATSDIALLKIEPKERLQAVKFAKDDDLLLGETVIALGNPFGLGLSVSRGILSSMARRPHPDERGSLDFQDWLQTDAAVNPGNSGGPLINLRGELIGINNAVFRKENAQGISFAIPVKLVGEALSEIFTPENKGFWFGARIKSDLSKLSVSSIQNGSPAEKAGLRAGDTILRIADKTPKNFIEFIVELVKRSENKNVPLMILRDGEQHNVTVQIIREETVFNADLIREKLGVTLQAVTPDVAEALEVHPGSGLVITGVDKNSPAAATGLRPGLLVTGIDDEPIADVKAAAKRIYEKRKGDKVSFNLFLVQRKNGFLFSTPGRVDVQVR